MAKERCTYCGRKFPEGQGIKLTLCGEELAFHSNKCLARFLKLLVERVEAEKLRAPLKELLKELKEKHKMLEERAKKRI